MNELTENRKGRRVNNSVCVFENKLMMMRLEKIDGITSDDETKKINRKMSVIQAEIEGLEEDIRRAEQAIEHGDTATAVYEPPSNSFV